jgi:hypothetical protein
MQHTCNIGWCQLLLPLIDSGPFCQLLHLSIFDMVQLEVLWSGWLFQEWLCHENVVQLGIPICRTAVPWWTWWSAILAVKFHIPWFQALLWLHVDSIQKRILRALNEIFKSQNGKFQDYVRHSWSFCQNFIIFYYTNKYIVLKPTFLYTSEWSKLSCVRQLQHTNTSTMVLPMTISCSFQLSFLNQSTLSCQVFMA